MYDCQFGVGRGVCVCTCVWFLWGGGSSCDMYMEAFLLTCAACVQSRVC